MPDIGSAVLLVVSTAFMGTVLADRRRGTWAVLGTLGALQVELHVMLTWMSGLGHPHGVLPSWTMVVCHAGAAIGIGLVLAHADTALAAVAQTPASLSPLPSAWWPARRPLGIATSRSADIVASTLVLLRVCARRVPPSLQF